jgi:hypothetical protein
MTPSPRARKEARRHPNGRVFESDTPLAPGVKVSPAHITGAWRVDARGRIVGEFIPNPNYRMETGSPGGWLCWHSLKRA